jgi:hypothetical protein
MKLPMKLGGPGGTLPPPAAGDDHGHEDYQRMSPVTPCEICQQPRRGISVCSGDSTRPMPEVIEWQLQAAEACRSTPHPNVLVNDRGPNPLSDASGRSRCNRGWTVRRKPIRNWTALGLSVIVALGCSSDDGEKDDTGVTATATSPDTTPAVDTTTAPTASETTTPPLSPHSAPLTTEPAAPITEIELLGSPDWLVVDDHGVWVRMEPALVGLLDPATNDKIGEVSVGGAPCQGLGAGAGSIFTCAGTDVVRIDPGSMAVIATYPVGKAFSQGELAVSDHTLWVLLGDGSMLLPIDTDTDTAGTPIALPVRGTDLAYGEAGLWVASAVDDTVLHLDPATGALLHTVATPNGPFSLAIEDDVWAMGANETVRIDPASGAIDLTVPVGGGHDGSVAVSPGTVWLHGTEVLFTKIDRRDGTVIDDPDLAAAAAEIATRMTSAGDSVFGFGSIWSTAHDDSRLFRVAIQ